MELYDISVDNANWSTQWLTRQEAYDLAKDLYVVHKKSGFYIIHDGLMDMEVQ